MKIFKPNQKVFVPSDNEMGFECVVYFDESMKKYINLYSEFLS